MRKFLDLIGEDAQTLTAFQMALRAVIIFIIALIIMRFAGRRSFGMRSPFDNVLSILIGAVLSQSILEPSVSFFTPVTGAVTLAFLHRTFAWLSVQMDFFGVLVKGKVVTLFENGIYYEAQMRKKFISKKDLEEGLRKFANSESMDKIQSICIERDGNLSYIKKE